MIHSEQNQEMTDFNYRQYSLEQLSNWIHDAMSAGEATPQEIYDVIVGVVKENYYTYKQKTSEAYELLALLNSGVDNNKYQDYLNKILRCDEDNSSPDRKGVWSGVWSDFWQEYYYPEKSKLHVTEDGDIYPVKDKVVKWQLPVEVDGLTGDCFVNFPDDLLEAANLKEGDTVNWIDRGDGSFELRKVTKPLGMDEC